MLAQSFDQELFAVLDDRIVNGGPAKVNSGNYFHDCFSIGARSARIASLARSRGWLPAIHLTHGGMDSGTAGVPTQRSKAASRVDICSGLVR